MPIPKNLTTKTQEVLEGTQALAQSLSHQSVTPLHLLSTILTQDETTVEPLLRKDDPPKIIDLQLGYLSRCLKDKDITLEAAPEAKKLLMTVGYDQVYGARPLKRVIQDMIVDELALQLIEGEIKQGQKVKVTADNGKISFKQAHPQDYISNPL